MMVLTSVIATINSTRVNFLRQMAIMELRCLGSIDRRLQYIGHKIKGSVQNRIHAAPKTKVPRPADW
jgi:hypothetical protein